MEFLKLIKRIAKKGKKKDGKVNNGTATKKSSGKVIKKDAQPKGSGIKGTLFTEDMDSRMIPFSGNREVERFYSDMQLEKALAAFSATHQVPYKASKVESMEIVPSRYSLKNEIYSYSKGIEDKAVIRMTGDLLCRSSQQKSALVDGKYDFTATFSSVSKLLADADLTIGNMEISEDIPKEFLSAIRNSGFDMMINAQEKSNEHGVQGTWEALNSLNECQLMHTGVFSALNELRYILLDVNGIRIAVTAFMDRERQRMSCLNLSESGVDALFNCFDKVEAQAIIDDAKAAGAEFIIAYCHWGKERTERISDYQQRFVRMIAEAGVDYIFGSQQYCPQPRTVILTNDGRKVPCIYSSGSFVSDNSTNQPDSRDTLVTTLCLERDKDMKVQLVEEYYQPCRVIVDNSVRGRVIVKTCEDMLESDDVMRQMEAEEAFQRIAYAVGESFQMKRDGIISNKICDEIEQYAISHPAIAKIFPGQEKADVKAFKADNEGIYRRERDMGVNEAVLCLAGQLSYDVQLEKSSLFGDVCQFHPGFRYIPDCVKGADLVIGNLNTVCADIYLSSGSVGGKLNNGYSYSNARPEYLDALKYAGFNCLAAASPHNMDCGIEGVNATLAVLKENDIIPSGLGREGKPVFVINGIKISVLSYTYDCPNSYNMITEEGADLFLSIYSKNRVEEDIRQVRAKGAEFVLVYVNCWSEDNELKLSERRMIAKEIVEAGADYIVCTRPNVISDYEIMTASDGHRVPVVTSLGTFSAGTVKQHQNVTAMIKLTVRKDIKGNIETVDNYIPIKRFEYLKGTANLVGPAMKHFNPDYEVNDYQRVKGKLTELLGEKICVNEERKVTLGSHYSPQITPKEICETLGASLTSKEIAQMGKAYTEPVSRVVTRKLNVNSGSVAVMVPQLTTPRDQITVEDAIAKGAVMIVDTKKSDKIPTLVVDEDLIDVYMKIIGAIRDKYDPVTVAITGTVGKTTTKELMSYAFDNHYRSLHIEGNHNTVYTVGLIVQKLTKAETAFVQEVHGGTPKSCGRISDAIKPDICVVTAIGEGHLGQLGSMENVIKEKMSVISGMKKGGTLIINDDNKYLHEQHPDVHTIRYSMHDESCDYYARNIKAVEDRITFQICCEEGVFDAVLNFQGIHNVSNALAVFAAGRAANIPPHRIIAGMARYIPEDDRQNLMEINGYRIIVDSYSSTPLSVKSAIDTLCSLSVPEGGRRIAVVADIPDQGDDTVKNHLEVGREIGKEPFDLLLCCGDASRYIVAGAKEQGKEAYFFEKRDTFNRKIIEVMRPNDIILFKAGTRVHLKEQTIIPIFGDIVS